MLHYIYMRPRILMLITLLIALGGVAFFLYERSRWSIRTDGDLCYFSSAIGASGLADVMSLKLSIIGTTASGELDSFPANKDPVKGTLLGTIREDGVMRELDALYTYNAGAVPTVEERIIRFDTLQALVGVGEMVAGQDDVYVYKDKKTIQYNQMIPSVKCGAVQQTILK